MIRTIPSTVVLISALCHGCSAGVTEINSVPAPLAADGGVEDGGDQPLDPVLPHAQAKCPEIKTGEAVFNGKRVQLWVSENYPDVKGPLVIYWHATGSNTDEVYRFAYDALDDINFTGGIIAAPKETTEEGDYNGPQWTYGDYTIADEIVACTADRIDTRRIYTAGASGGGLQAGQMAYERSGYIAAAMMNSGGIVGAPVNKTNNVPAVITTHGAADQDVIIVSFTETSAALTSDISRRGGLAVNCPHPYGHCQAPPDILRAQWNFLKEHPYGAAAVGHYPELTDDYPDSCEIVEYHAPDGGF